MLTKKLMDQAAHSVIMIRPVSFGFNSETAQSNVFQNDSDDNNVSATAQKEFDGAVKILHQHGVEVKLFEDNTGAPDAIFLNNWFFTLPDGKVVLCPMESGIRRKERRMDIISWLEDHYQVNELIDITGFELKDQFLEGTGSLVFDHIHKKAYACPSSRTDENLVQEICSRIEYQPILFQSRDENGRDIYHTNVLISIGTGYAIVCLDAVHPADHEVVLESLSEDDIKVIAISYEHMKSMAGNALELQTKGLENILVMSETAVQSLLPGQIDNLSKQIEIVSVDIPTIEKVGGGSIRCMLAGLHLPANFR